MSNELGTTKGVENQATLETEGKLMARMKPHVNVLKQLIFKLSLISARNHQFVAITRDELHKV